MLIRPLPLLPSPYPPPTRQLPLHDHRGKPPSFAIKERMLGRTRTLTITNIKLTLPSHPHKRMQPNTGVTFYRAPCPCVSHGKVKECKPKYGRCMNGTRFIPVKLLDVAGLVPGASEVGEGGREERRTEKREVKGLVCGEDKVWEEIICLFISFFSMLLLNIHPDCTNHLLLHPPPLPPSLLFFKPRAPGWAINSWTTCAMPTYSCTS